ncbi:MAG: hypothetical protein LUF89_11040 [Ruminococcus sp.]|nr:hypothetical protein [Ruminococcus sp.]
MNGKKLSIQLLNQTEQEQCYSNLLLDHALFHSDLDEHEKRLCALLYYGVIERRITLDTVIMHYSNKPISKIDRTVRNVLRLGIYQLLYCEQIPARAAVNECVSLTRSFHKASASGFVNAILRSFLRDDCKIPYPKEKDAAMAVEYVVPIWLRYFTIFYLYNFTGRKRKSSTMFFGKASGISVGTNCTEIWQLILQYDVDTFARAILQRWILFI